MGKNPRYESNIPSRDEYIFKPSISPFLAYKFSLTCLVAKKTNSFESNNITFYEFIYRNWDIGGVQICGCTRQGLKVIPWRGGEAPN